MNLTVCCGADRPFSLVLHGPPGTDKTTLVEALAGSCGVAFVEVTPSDIVVGGEEEVERRASGVFEALTLLTRAVVLFDEFDPVLWRRDVFEDAFKGTHLPHQGDDPDRLHNGAEEREAS